MILTNSSRSFQDTCTVETGLSDFHKLVVTVLKLYFPKQKPNIQTFRDYKRFQNDLFRSELDYELTKLDVCNLELEHFLNIFIEILNKIKKKYLRANQGEFMSKELNKAIMTRSRLRNKYLKEKSADSKIAYDKQRNYCANLLRRTKKKYFANINISSITDNKKFWKTVKPLFSDKISHKETINLAVNDTILSDDQAVADTFNNYFNNIVKNLLTVTNKNYPKETANSVNLNLLDPVEAAILKFKNHPSLNAIRDKMSKLDNPKFYFQYTSFDQILKELEKLDPRKTSQMNDIPVKVIKGNKDIVAFFIHHNFNNSLSSFTFPIALKYAGVKPVFKKDDNTNKENHRPISILPTLRKVYERLIYNQMYPYFDKLFSKFQCGFRKGFNDQHCLITMIEKWRRSVDGGGLARALLTDLSKAFDCINHELLITKLYAYGFDRNSLYFINSYLKGRKQRIKINSSYSAFAVILFGVPQGSILGPLLFNIYICDLFIEDSDIDIANYADDNTPYACSSDIDSVIFKLQKNTAKIFRWFYNNNLISNAEKGHLIVSPKKSLEIQVSSCSIRNEDSVKLLGIHLNNDLNFDYHIN